MRCPNCNKGRLVPRYISLDEYVFMCHKDINSQKKKKRVKKGELKAKSTKESASKGPNPNKDVSTIQSISMKLASANNLSFRNAGLAA